MGLKDKLYTLSSVPSDARTIPWDGFLHAAKTIGNGYVIANFHYGVSVGEIREGAIQWLDRGHEDQQDIEESFISGISFFNEIMELRYWRNGQLLMGRERRDDSGIKISYIDADMVLRGVVAEKLLPSFQVKSGKTLYIKTRNYISESQIGQSGYFDSRYVKMIKL
jgi:hypothetical protein